MAGEDQGNVALAEVEAPVSDAEVVETPGDLELSGEVTETAEDETQAETPDPVSSRWEGKTDQEIEAAIEAVRKETENNVRNDERQKTTAEFGRKQAQLSLEYVAKGGLRRDLEAIYEAAINGNTNVVDEQGRLRPGLEQTLVNGIMPALRDTAVAEHLNLLGEQLTPGAKVPAEVLDEVDLLRQKTRQFDQKGFPLATPQDVFKAATKAIIDANIAAATPKIKAEAVKEYKKTQEARNQLEADREVNAANGSRPRPTNGASGGNFKAPDPHSIIEDPYASLADKQKAYRAINGHDFGS